MTFTWTARTAIVPTITAIAAAIALSAGQPAAAAPVSPTPGNLAAQTAPVSTLKSTAAPVQLAQYRGRHWRYGRGHGRWGYRRGPRWRGYGPGVAGTIAGAIIGGSIIASQRGHRGAWERCDATYRSFSWDDGTFQPYEGPRRLCPYLMP